MSYRIAGIDVHKKMLAVVVSDVEIESEFQFERRMFSSLGSVLWQSFKRTMHLLIDMMNSEVEINR